jgi:hypothetical protein
VYEVATPKPDIRTYDSAPPAVRKLFDIHGARALCMGHTHRPWGIWDEGPAPGGGTEPRFHGNSGSWCPAFRDQDCTERVLARRPLLMLSSNGEALWGGQCWWDGEALTPEPGAAREEPAREMSGTEAVHAEMQAGA